MGNGRISKLCTNGDEVNSESSDAKKITSDSFTNPGSLISENEKTNTLYPDRDFEIDDRYKRVIIRQWQTLVNQAPDVFYKTMLLSVGSSSKFTQIIGHGDTCQINLSKWPRLNEIGNAQLKFFENIVVKEKLSSKVVKQQATHLGETHKTYARYGMKPHFLDIYQQNFMEQLQNVIIEDRQEKMDFIEGWKLLIRYMIERTYYVYSVHEL